MEMIAAILGLIQGVLVMLNKRSNWIFYILQMIFLIIFSAINHLYGDVINNTFYLIFGFIGYMYWSKKIITNKIRTAKYKEKIIYITIIILGTIILSMFL